MTRPSIESLSDDEFFAELFESRPKLKDQRLELTQFEIDEIMTDLDKPTINKPRAEFYEGLLKQVQDTISRQSRKTYAAPSGGAARLVQASPVQDLDSALSKEEIDEVLAGLDESVRTPPSAFLQRFQEAVSRQS